MHFPFRRYNNHSFSSNFPTFVVRDRAMCIPDCNHIHINSKWKIFTDGSIQLVIQWNIANIDDVVNHRQIVRQTDITKQNAAPNCMTYSKPVTRSTSWYWNSHTCLDSCPPPSFTHSTNVVCLLLARLSNRDVTINYINCCCISSSVSRYVCPSNCQYSMQLRNSLKTDDCWLLVNNKSNNMAKINRPHSINGWILSSEVLIITASLGFITVGYLVMHEIR